MFASSYNHQCLLAASTSLTSTDLKSNLTLKFTRIQLYGIMFKNNRVRRNDIFCQVLLTWYMRGFHDLNSPL